MLVKTLSVRAKRDLKLVPLFCTQYYIFLISLDLKLSEMCSIIGKANHDSGNPHGAPLIVDPVTLKLCQVKQAWFLGINRKPSSKQKWTGVCFTFILSLVMIYLLLFYVLKSLPVEQASAEFVKSWRLFYSVVIIVVLVYISAIQSYRYFLTHTIVLCHAFFHASGMPSYLKKISIH